MLEFQLTSRFKVFLGDITREGAIIVMQDARTDPRYDELKPTPTSKMWGTHELALENDPTYRAAYESYQISLYTAQMGALLGAAFMVYVDQLEPAAAEDYWAKFIAVAKRNGVRLDMISTPAPHDVGGAMFQITQGGDGSKYLALMALSEQMRKDVGLLFANEQAIANERKSPTGDGGGQAA